MCGYGSWIVKGEIMYSEQLLWHRPRDNTLTLVLFCLKILWKICLQETSKLVIFPLKIPQAIKVIMWLASILPNYTWIANLIVFVGIIHFLDYLPEKEKYWLLATHSQFSFPDSWGRGPGIHQTYNASPTPSLGLGDRNLGRNGGKWL